MIYKTIKLSVAFLMASFISVSQEVIEPIKESKKIQEVVSIAPIQKEGDTASAKPVASSEVLKRALNFIRTENSKYSKSTIVNVGNKAECMVSFKYKPKELNPKADVEGAFTMHLSIEAKDGKYRYSISKLTHTAKNSDCTGGDIYAEVPTCGSMKLSPPQWNQMKSDALKNTTLLITDLKETMKLSSAASVDKDDW